MYCNSWQKVMATTSDTITLAESAVTDHSEAVDVCLDVVLTPVAQDVGR